MNAPSVTALFRPPRVVHDDRLTTFDLSEEVIGASMGPFLLVSLFDMRAPLFPPHPHAGFSVATYMLPESPIGFINQDSLGNRNRIAPGALHVTQAGSGVLHEEQPERHGSSARGFQIWIDHPDSQRELPPAALHLAAADAPQVAHSGANVRLLLGEAFGERSPISLAIGARLLDIELAAGATLMLPLADEEHSFVFVHRGTLVVADTLIQEASVAATTRPGGMLRLQAVDTTTRATLFAGPVVHSPRLRQGPFVASSVEQMQRFFDGYRAGRFGQLRPFTAEREPRLR